VKSENKIKYRLFVRDKLDKFKGNKKPKPTFEKIKDLFIIFDIQKYGESSYLPEGRIISESEKQSMLKGSWIGIETCYYMEVYSGGELLSSRYECETEYIWTDDMDTGDPGDLGGGGGGSPEDNSGSGGGGGNVAPVPAPEISFDPTFENNIKASCVMGNLVNTGASVYNPLVLSFLASFSGNEPYHDIVFKIEPINGSYGRFDGTKYPPIITLNSGTISNRSSIEIAKTLMHEMLHAFIYQDGMLNYSSFIDNFGEYLAKTGKGTYIDHHEMIYDHYVIPMINFLKAFDSLSGHMEDDGYYRGLALSGLQNVVGFTQIELNSITQAETFF